MTIFACVLNNYIDYVTNLILNFVVNSLKGRLWKVPSTILQSIIESALRYAPSIIYAMIRVYMCDIVYHPVCTSGGYA